MRRVCRDISAVKNQRVPTSDIHTFVKHLINMDKAAGFGADPFHFDKKPIHMPIVRAAASARNGGRKSQQAEHSEEWCSLLNTREDAG